MGGCPLRPAPAGPRGEAGGDGLDGGFQGEHGASTLSLRVPNQPRPASSAMSSQVVSTVGPMNSGPRCSFDSHAQRPVQRRQHITGDVHHRAVHFDDVADGCGAKRPQRYSFDLPP